ncbi:hypothetical protein QQ045_025968 [Rhodiola kirilowii]
MTLRMRNSKLFYPEGSMEWPKTYTFGFGYDKVSDDYVVSILYSSSPPSAHSIGLCVDLYWFGYYKFIKFRIEPEVQYTKYLVEFIKNVVFDIMSFYNIIKKPTEPSLLI